jgi:hypothetical protein
MKSPALKTTNNNLSKVQLRTFQKFRRKFKEKFPDYRLTWVLPYSETIIEAGVEFPQKVSYRKLRQVADLAIKLHDETGVLIILR